MAAEAAVEAGDLNALTQALGATDSGANSGQLGATPGSPSAANLGARDRWDSALSGALPAPTKSCPNTRH